MKKLCLVIPLFLIPLSLFAEYGCLVPGYPELLTYQTNPPGGIFSNTPGEIYPSAGCQWILNVSAPSNGCIGHGKGGISEPIIKNVRLMILFPYFLSLQPELQFCNLEKSGA